MHPAALCDVALLYILIYTWRDFKDGIAQKAFFLSAPPGGFQVKRRDGRFVGKSRSYHL